MSFRIFISLAIIGAASSANAAIAPLSGGIDSFAEASAVTYPYTALSGFDASGASKIVFTLSDEIGFGDGNVSGVTFGGNAMDLAVSAANSIQQARIYYLDASAVGGGSFGTGDLVINGAGSNDFGGSWLFLSGTADGVGPTNSSTTQSVDLTTLVDNSFVVAAHANNGSSGTAQSPLTPLLDGGVGSAGGGSGHSTIVTAGLGSYSFTGSNSRPITVAAAFLPGGGSSSSDFLLSVSGNGAAFDFSWPSQTDKIYDLVSSTDPSAPVSGWTVYDDGSTTHGDLAATPPTNTRTGVAGDGARRFFAVVEKEPLPVQTETLRVFLVGGQSNADGRAASSGLPTAPVNFQQPQADVDFYYKVEGQTPSLTTLRPDLSETGGFGPSITFGRALADQLGDGIATRVALIKYANGGTNQAIDWVAGGDATTSGDGAEYVTFQETVTNGLAALAAAHPVATIEIEGMIWLQGESDIQGGSTLWNNYQTNFANFINDIAATYGTSMPFIVIRLSDGQTALNATGLGVVRTAQQTVADGDPMTDWVDTDGFGMKGDNLHFDALGQQQIGAATAAKMLTFVSP